MAGRSYRKLLDFRLPKDPDIVKAGERAGGCTSRGYGSDTGSSLCAPFPQRNLSGRQLSARGFGDRMESTPLGTGEEDRKKEARQWGEEPCTLMFPRGPRVDTSLWKL